MSACNAHDRGFLSSRVRIARLARFARRYAHAAFSDSHSGWDYGAQCIRVAARIAGPLGYTDIIAVTNGFSQEWEALS